MPTQLRYALRKGLTEAMRETTGSGAKSGVEYGRQERCPPPRLKSAPLHRLRFPGSSGTATRHYRALTRLRSETIICSQDAINLYSPAQYRPVRPCRGLRSEEHTFELQSRQCLV